MQQAAVTGIDRGLGLSLVRNLLGRGSTVVAGHRDPLSSELEELQTSAGGRLILIPLDVSDNDSVADFTEEASARIDTLDLLINNAGVLGDTRNTIEDILDFDEIRVTMEVNAYGPLRMINQMLPLLQGGDGKMIATISSEAGSITRCRRNAWFGYCMSKAALNMGAKLAFNRLTEQGFRMIQFHPGWMRTYMSGELNTKATYSPDESAERIIAIIEEHKTTQMEEPLFIDVERERWPW